MGLGGLPEINRRPNLSRKSSPVKSEVTQPGPGYRRARPGHRACSSPAWPGLGLAPGTGAQAPRAPGEQHPETGAWIARPRSGLDRAPGVGPPTKSWSLGNLKTLLYIYFWSAERSGVLKKVARNLSVVSYPPFTTTFSTHQIE